MSCSSYPAKMGGPGLAVPGSGSWCPLLANTGSVAVASLHSVEPFQILFTVSVSAERGLSLPEPRPAMEGPGALRSGLYDRCLQSV